MSVTQKNSPLFQLNKVPEITLYFWLLKILCTTVGETAADYLNIDWHFGLTSVSIFMASLLAVALLIQVPAKQYQAWLYWLVVALISVVGTLITDNLVDNFGVALSTTTMIFSAALIVTFALWYAQEKTLSIHSIFTRQRELFYWAAILFTFALGTAAGDWLAEGFGLGYANSALLFGGMIGVVCIAYYGFKLNAIVAFWLAYILTRPLGASLGDYLSQSTENGGLGLGAGTTNLIFFATIVGLVIYLSIAQLDRQEKI
jgi:uncharacterized membrane-anchored protein